MLINVVFHSCLAAELNQIEKQYPVEDRAALKDILHSEVDPRTLY